MGQQVRDHQPGIVRAPADVHLYAGAVPQGHHAVELQGNGNPLVLADAAVVVGLEIGQFPVLIQGVGLQVQPGGVYVGGSDLNTLRQRLLPDVGQQHALAPVTEINLVSRLHRRAPDIGPVAGLLCQADNLSCAEPLGLTSVQKCLVVRAVRFHGAPLRRVHPVEAVAAAGEQLLLQRLKFLAFHVLFPP